MSKQRTLSTLLACSLLLSACPADWLDPLLQPTPTSVGSHASVHAEVRYRRQQVADHSGQQDRDNDMLTVSAEYELTLENPEAGSTALIALPINPQVLPEDFDPESQLQPERLNPDTGTWESTGHFAWYDASRQQVFFRDTLPTVQSSLSVQQSNPRSARFRIRVYIFSDQFTVSKEGSQFRYHYYPANLRSNKNRIQNNAEWNSSSGHATDPHIPDFIEDLDVVLNEAYQAMLKLKHSQGEVFKPLSVQDVYICDTGTSAGDSKLGGPMRISNKRIKDLQDLRLTATHELVHVFQGQYYTLQGLFTGRSNQWFIEATANYYTAAIHRLNDTQKKTFYGDFYSDYLSVGLNSNQDNSMYAAGHFLDWLSQKYHPQVIGDALRLSGGNDLIGLSKAIEAASAGKASLSDDYGNYLQAIMTRPEDTAGFHGDIRNAMINHAIGNGHLSSVRLSTERTYSTLQKALPVYSAAYASLTLHNLRNAMLVVENKGNRGSLLYGLSYALESNRNQDYTAALPLDRYWAYTQFRSQALPYFGNLPTNFSQMLYNASPASEAQLNQAYYVLQAPASRFGGSQIVNVKTDFLGNIPAENIRGLKVYNSHGLPVSPVIPVNREEETQALSHNPASGARATVVDKYDNEWPFLLGIQPKSDTRLKSGQSLRLEAHLVGFEDTQLNWELEPVDDKSSPGRLSGQGRNATYNAPQLSPGESTSVRIRVRSQRYPAVSTSLHVSSYREFLPDPDWEPCLEAGTEVILANGSRRPIEHIQPGDKIRAFDESQDKVVESEVEHVLQHRKNAELHQIQTASGQDLKITGNHPVFTAERGWLQVDDLQAGMHLYRLDARSGQFELTQVMSVIREVSQADVVYNLKTSAGNYFAAELLLHNKCLQAGSLIETPQGPRTVESLQPGDKVWSQALNGQRIATPITRVFRKETVLPTLPGKQLSAETAVTHNHRLFWQQRWLSAGETHLPDVSIPGPVYDLETEQGTYFSAGQLMGSASQEQP